MYTCSRHTIPDVPPATAPESRTTALNAAHQRPYHWNEGGRDVEIAIHDSGGPGPAVLLLPALRTISSRSEWEPFCEALLEGCQRHGNPLPRLIRVDWPGFGESQRPRLTYSAELLARFLADFRREVCPADYGLIAAGQAAGIALLASERHGLAFRDWVLLAPTWRGPFPTMARRRSRVSLLIRSLVEAPTSAPCSTGSTPPKPRSAG
jgi:pimeloyl-ACP methyl ester carboxylesterase